MDKMKNNFTIKKDPNILVASHLKEFLTPQTIYLPINKEIMIKTSQKIINKSQLLFEIAENKTFSPISGKIKKIVNLNTKQYLVIENDFKEKQNNKLARNKKLTKQEVIARIKEFCPQLLKKLIKKDSILYFNAIKDNPYDANNLFIFKTYGNEILETLDILRETFSYQEIHLLLSEKDTENITCLTNLLGRYPFICLHLLPNIYPLENEVILKKILNKDKINILKDTEVLILQKALLENEPLSEIYVTISGNGVKPFVVKTKKGVLLADLLQEFKIDWQQKVLVNGLINGQRISQDEMVLLDCSCLLFFIEEPKIPSPCISCGKCLNYCPMGCNPVDQKRMSSCIHCGLCSFLCPSNLPLGKEHQNENLDTLF